MDVSSVLGSLLQCTDQSDFSICLANEMMTYGGWMNSSDEASFSMQSSGLVGGARVSVWLPLPAGFILFSGSCHLAHARVARAHCVILNELGGPL